MFSPLNKDNYPRLSLTSQANFYIQWRKKWFGHLVDFPQTPPPPPHHKVKNRLSFPKLGFFCNTAGGRGDYTVHAKESEDSQISLTEVVANTYILQGSRKSQ